MAIGGPMWQKSQANSRQGSYAQAMSQQFKEQQRANLAALGSALFGASVNNSAGMVELALKAANSRLRDELSSKSVSTSDLVGASSLGSQLDVLA